MIRFPLLSILFTTLLYSFNVYAEPAVTDDAQVDAATSLNTEQSWQDTQYRSQLWVWGWTIADVTSIVNNIKTADQADGAGRRVRAKAEGIRAALGLWSVWKHKPAYFSLTTAPTKAQRQAQSAKANEVYRWQSRIPNLVVNVVLAAWIAEDGDQENAITSFGSGIFWGEVSLWTQRMLDTDWQWRIQDDQLHLSKAFLYRRI